MAAGFPLPGIVSTISSATMAENAALKAQVADLENQVARLTPAPAPHLSPPPVAPAS